jgi:hypothetical protein
MDMEPGASLARGRAGSAVSATIGGIWDMLAVYSTRQPTRFMA